MKVMEQEINEIFKQLNVVCANEHFDSDEDFARKLNLIYDNLIEEGLKKGGMQLINHKWSNDIIARRVKSYCDRKNIDITNYDGPLPFRAFKIDLNK